MPELIEQPAVETAEVTPTQAQQDSPAQSLVEEELLIEDVSIDGMCGVY